MKKLLKITFVFLFVSSCGYVPIYSNTNNTNIKISITSFEGDKDINNSISQILSRYQNDNSEKVYSVKINTIYDKKTLTKNAAGDITNYRINLNVVFSTIIRKETKTFNYSEKFDMKKGETIFEEQNYENIIKKDMVSVIVQKFISQLLELK